MYNLNPRPLTRSLLTISKLFLTPLVMKIWTPEKRSWYMQMTNLWIGSGQPLPVDQEW